MKSLIVIGAYCPDAERKQLLENCINSLQPIRKDFDILISSHVHVSEYIVDKVDYYFYDKDNELITDWDLMNTPWFSPKENLNIVSSLISNYSVYLAVYKTLINGLGCAKNLGYKNIHWVEYDSFFTNYSDFYDNLNILKDYVSVQYVKPNILFESNLPWGQGCFQAINLDKVNNLFIKYNKKELLKMLKESPYKTNEYISQVIYTLDNEKIYHKNFNEIQEKGNKFNLSSFIKTNDLDDWTVPFYDTKTDKINFIAWNSKKDEPINVSFLINQNKLITINNINKFEWKMADGDNINNINEILTIVNNKLKQHIDISTPELKEKFKRSNQTQYK
jgi:hypothetical protein